MKEERIKAVKVAPGEKPEVVELENNLDTLQKTEYGVSESVVGHYGHFDTFAAHAVREAKKHHPKVMLTLLIPYYPYNNDTSGYDRTFYPPGMEDVLKPFAIVRANEYMIRTSNYLICYDRGQIGKTRDYVELARQSENRGKLHIEFI